MKGKYLYLVVIGILIVIIVVIGYRNMYPSVTTVMFVRHAEKDSSGGVDPPLSPEGSARARELAHVVAKSGIDAIFVTEYQRTQETVAPAAQELGITTIVLRWDQTEELVREILSDHSGEEVLVAGHSDTVPAAIRALGISTPPSIENTVYDDLFVVHVVNSLPRLAKLTRLKYGSPSP